jgi:hypothetical protein
MSARKRLLTVAAAAMLMTVSVAANADCPDSLATCNDGAHFGVGNCWRWGALNCVTCDPGEAARLCAPHGGVQSVVELMIKNKNIQPAASRTTTSPLSGRDGNCDGL